MARTSKRCSSPASAPPPARPRRRRWRSLPGRHGRRQKHPVAGDDRRRVTAPWDRHVASVMSFASHWSGASPAAMPLLNGPRHCGHSGALDGGEGREEGQGRGERNEMHHWQDTSPGRRSRQALVRSPCVRLMAMVFFDYRFSIVWNRFQCYCPGRLERDLGPNARERLLRGVEWLEGIPATSVQLRAGLNATGETHAPPKEGVRHATNVVGFPPLGPAAPNGKRARNSRKHLRYGS